MLSILFLSILHIYIIIFLNYYKKTSENNRNQLKYIIWKILYFLLSNVFLGFFVLVNKKLFSKIIAK